MKTTLKLSLLAAALLASPFAIAANCSLTIGSNDSLNFSTDELVVDDACKEVELTLTHSGTLPRNAMGHNWVLSTAADAQGVNQAGMQAGLDNQYVKPGDPRVIAFTPVIGGGEKTTITFSTENLDPDTAYKFFCTFPGHFAIMQGTFRIKE